MQPVQTGNARPDMDLEVLSFTLLGSIASIIMLSYQHEGDVDVLARRFADEYARILRDGIFVSDVSRKAAKPRKSQS